MTVLEQINEIYEGAKRRDRNFNEANYYWSIGSDVLAEISRCLTVSGSTILLNGIRVDGDVIRKRRIALCGNRYKERNYSNYYTNPPYKIKNVIFNDPATIVYWADGTKTVVKVQDGEKFDPEKGLAMAISKKALGNQGNYFETFKKYCPVVEEEVINEAYDCAHCLYVDEPTDGEHCNECCWCRGKTEMFTPKDEVRSCKKCKYDQLAINDTPCCDCNKHSKFEPK